MIFVAKPPIDSASWPEPLATDLKSWKLKADEEKTNNCGCFNAAGKPKRNKKTKFDCYGKEPVRTALNRLFRFKCAYCEHHYGAGQPVAIEHFRPKGPVIENGRSIPPGYYWLAAEWLNLLPSCTDCNSQRYHDYGPGGTAGSAAKPQLEKRGKGQLFPLVDPTKRARTPGAERHEKPLLLDPTLDDPGDHLEFPIGTQKLGCVQPRSHRGADSERGIASISVFGLDRPQLKLARAQHAKRALAQMRFVERCANDFASAPTAKTRDSLKREIDQLTELYLELNNPFLAITRAVLAPEIRTLVKRADVRAFSQLFDPAIALLP